MTATKLSRSALDAARRVAVDYEEFQSTVAAGQTDGGTPKCPAKHPHAVAGYFGSDENGVVEGGKIVATNSNPINTVPNNREWDIGVKNVDTQPHQWFGGVVCER